jgi:hypothetical protein
LYKLFIHKFLELLLIHLDHFGINTER